MSDTDFQGAAPTDARDLEIIEIKKQRDAAEAIVLQMMGIVAIGSIGGPSMHAITAEAFHKTLEEARPIAEAMMKRRAKKSGGVIATTQQ